VYSHDLIAKKKAPIASWFIAFCFSVNCNLDISSNTIGCTAFCCFSAGSLFLKLLKVLKRTNAELNKTYECVTAFLHKEDIQKGDKLSSITAKYVVETWMKLSKQLLKEEIIKDTINNTIRVFHQDNEQNRTKIHSSQG